MIIKLVEPPASHICEPPKEPQKLYGLGTIWACDVCGRQAVLKNSQREGYYWEWTYDPARENAW